MGKDQIIAAWKQSRQKPFDDSGKLKHDSTHATFPDEMVKRTVLNRACKRYINTSSDNALVRDTMRRADETADEAEFEAQVAEESNQEFLDVDPETGAVLTDEKNNDTPEKKGYPHMDGQENLDTTEPVNSGPSF